MHDIQSVLHPAGIEAARIGHLWWVMFTVCTIVWFAVAIATLVAMRRGRSRTEHAPDRVLSRNVAVAAGISIVALVGLLFESIVTGRSLEDVASKDALHIQVTGNQWWWDVQYENPIAGNWVITANEMHIPVGRPVVVDLLATDVIHSLWIPNLQGKIDLIPGRRNVMTLQADREGVYRGQCAEYCGVQHAHMALVVVADPPDTFESWLAANRAPAPAPITPEQIRGKEVVERGPCAMCHAISGTLAGARTAPDLTHIATRSTLAAGTVPNTRGYLAGWIMDPQHIKPGNRMPSPGLSSDELQAVLDYLETLK
jgi:cytochrome c oxidase subunit II